MVKRMSTVTRGAWLRRMVTGPGALALAAVIAASAAACSGSTSASPFRSSQAAANPGGIYVNAPVAAVSAMPAGSTMDKIRKRGVLIVGGSEDAPLWSALNPQTGQVEGFDADLAKLLAYYITGKPNATVTMVSTTETREAMIENGTVDVVFQTYTITPQRAKQVDFAGPYYMSGLAIATKKGNPTFNSLADLAGKTVILEADSPSVAEIQKDAPTAKIVTFASNPMCMQALNEGRGDAFVDDLALLVMDTTQDPQLQIDTNALTSEPYGIGLKLGDTAMKQFVNAWLQKIEADGVWQRVWKNTVGTVVAGNPPTPPQIGSVPGS
jgi:glutamate transport system substrate-binding protein